ncbi:LysE family transporter [Ignicoccus islandicus]|uniref:LysE family transporter n=1 Tax=Ignicoccus islandicus TaxID=54259 RepID=UPI0009467AE5|nr:LysE family transporter [Ignicoccus islandicus]
MLRGDYKEIALRTILVTPSGAFSPGLLSAAAVAVGTSLGPVGGLIVSTGHVAFELPYVFVLSKLMGKLKPVIRRLEKPLSLIVLAFSLFFAWGLIQGGSAQSNVSVSDAFLAGFVFTASNVYFLLWWATIGLPLVELTEGRIDKFLVMYSSHAWLDYLWLGLLAGIGNVSNLLGPYQIAFNATLAALLVIFALDITLRSFFGKSLLP